VKALQRQGKGIKERALNFSKLSDFEGKKVGNCKDRRSK